MNVLFLCRANSARSQMAEALARDLFKNKNNIEFFSAGSKPSFVHPIAIKVILELGINMNSHSSKSIKNLPKVPFDQVITLCADEVCPVFLKATHKKHWPFKDPASAPKENLIECFRDTRDKIKKKLQSLKV